MLTLTTNDGTTLTAATDVLLANLLLEHRHGRDWSEDLCPFDEHTLMGQALDELALVADGTLDGYTLTREVCVELQAQVSAADTIPR